MWQGMTRRETTPPQSAHRPVSKLSLHIVWSLILAACGGGGGGGGKPETGSAETGSIPATEPVGSPPITSPVATEPVPPPRKPPADATKTLAGRVIDGPVEGVEVYLDVNGNGRVDSADQHIGTTNRGGYYTGTVPLALTGHPVIAMLTSAIDHGRDPASDDDNRTFTEGTLWRAPTGSSMITPLTESLVRAYGPSPTTGNKRDFAVAVGLPADVDVTALDPYTHEDQTVRERFIRLGEAAWRMLQDQAAAPPDKDRGDAFYTQEINRHYADIRQEEQRRQEEERQREEAQQPRRQLSRLMILTTRRRDGASRRTPPLACKTSSTPCRWRTRRRHCRLGANYWGLWMSAGCQPGGSRSWT